MPSLPVRLSLSLCLVVGVREVLCAETPFSPALSTLQPATRTRTAPATTTQPLTRQPKMVPMRQQPARPGATVVQQQEALTWTTAP